MDTCVSYVTKYTCCLAIMTVHAASLALTLTLSMYSTVTTFVSTSFAIIESTVSDAELLIPSHMPMIDSLAFMAASPSTVSSTCTFTSKASLAASTSSSAFLATSCKAAFEDSAAPHIASTARLCVASAASLAPSMSSCRDLAVASAASLAFMSASWADAPRSISAEYALIAAWSVSCRSSCAAAIARLYASFAVALASALAAPSSDIAFLNTSFASSSALSCTPSIDILSESRASLTASVRPCSAAFAALSA
mmetsp:Transcript_29969/g.69702  ORF Transcript_29969/g.69702 Transcript_29969/m.69702 type:complete len:253 (+) Transcript_29969:698-1456(+)